MRKSSFLLVLIALLVVLSPFFFNREKLMQLRLAFRMVLYLLFAVACVVFAWGAVTIIQDYFFK